MDAVYIVEHSHEFPNGKEDIKLIGVYTSDEAARAAVERLRLQPGFCDHPDGFTVSKYPLNQDHWTDGFVSWDEASKR